jgi:DNA (cytosine-5)-methyltransferase 1
MGKGKVETKRTDKIASLYCGAGGLDYGFHMTEGFEHVFANDFDKDACATYRTNFAGADQYLRQGPIENYLQELFGLKFDILLAGFPCPSWSMAGKRGGFDDKRGQEFFTCLSVLHICRPKMFVFENVRGLLSHDGGHSFAFMINALKNLGYFVEYKLVKMSEHGVPTERARVLIVGSLLEGEELKAIFPTVEAKNNLKLKHVLKKVGPLGNGLTNHNLHAPQKKMHWISILKEGEQLPRLSSTEVRAREAALGLTAEKIPTSIMDYRRLDREKIAPTMMFGNTSLPIHPTENRNLSVRETAAIQGFPLTFVFEGGIAAQYKQVGNAVPPIFSTKLAAKMSSYLLNNEPEVVEILEEQPKRTKKKPKVLKVKSTEVSADPVAIQMAPESE